MELFSLWLFQSHFQAIKGDVTEDVLVLSFLAGILILTVKTGNSVPNRRENLREHLFPNCFQNPINSLDNLLLFSYTLQSLSKDAGRGSVFCGEAAV